MNRVTIALIPLLALAACGKSDDGPKTPEQAAAEVAKAEKMKPGQWRTTMQITKFEMPNAPPEMKDMLQKSMGQAQTMEQCVTKEQAERDPQEFLKQGQQGDCTYERFTVNGGAVDAKMSCKLPQGQMDATMTGSIGAEKVAIAMETTTTGGQMPGAVNMAMKMDSVRIGECK